jgi:hypothetical protein
MKITYGQLRRVIKEVAMSPSVFQNNKPISDPFDRSTIANAISSLEEPFRRAVEQNLVLASKDSYNAETREFDDAAYQRVQELSQKAAEAVMARVHKAVQQTWQETMKSVGSSQPTQKKVAA